MASKTKITTHENTIAKIGFEIEGEWSSKLQDKINLDNLGKMVGDGSIHLCGQDDEDNQELTCENEEGHEHDTTDCYSEQELDCADDHEHNEDCPRTEQELTCDIETDHWHNDDCYSENENTNDHDGHLEAHEYNSHPIDRKTYRQEATAFFKLLQDEWNQNNFHNNDSMGFHIHLSFSPQFPPSIFSKEFVDFFHQEAEKYFPEVMKSRGKNQYCKTEIKEHNLVDRYNGDRYHSINLWPAFEKHGTVEVRLWPSDEPKKMLEYLIFTVRTFERFLDKPFVSTFEQVLDLDLFPVENLASIKTANSIPFTDEYARATNENDDIVRVGESYMQLYDNRAFTISTLINQTPNPLTYVQVASGDN